MKIAGSGTTADENLLWLSALGLTSGLMIGCVMIAFRMAVEGLQSSFLPGANPENYEALPLVARLCLPIAGAVILGLLLHWLPREVRDVGPVHVLDRLERHEGRLPIVNAFVQFIGGAVSIIFGHSVGREGPAIHVGAATASYSGQLLGRSPQELRALTGCGVAAAIAASFNTPLAGVVFAMEVVLMEYSVAGFAPVILAAVGATALNRLAYDGEIAFAVPTLTMRSLFEMPYVLGVGTALGLMSAAFVFLLCFFATRAARIPYLAGCIAGGIAVGLCALAVPEVMGIGYDTVDAALLGKLSLVTLLSVAAFKLVATAAGVGLGLPGGIVGPTFVIGAAGGGFLGIVGGWIMPQYASSPGFYALIGMGAMMAGTLHAPLAALTAMLELTGNPNIIWPGMLACISAFAVSRALCGQEPAFLALLHARRKKTRSSKVEPEKALVHSDSP